MDFDASDATDAYFLWWKEQFEANHLEKRLKTSLSELGNSHLGIVYDRDKDNRKMVLRLGGREFIVGFEDRSRERVGFFAFSSFVPSSKLQKVAGEMTGGIERDKYLDKNDGLWHYPYYILLEHPVVGQGNVVYEGDNQSGILIKAEVKKLDWTMNHKRQELFNATRKYIITSLNLNIEMKS